MDSSKPSSVGWAGSIHYFWLRSDYDYYKHIWLKSIKTENIITSNIYISAGSDHYAFIRNFKIV